MQTQNGICERACENSGPPQMYQPRLSLGRVPQAIQRLKMKSIKRDAELLISCR